MNISNKRSFNGSINNTFVELFTLKNTAGLTAQFTNYGARWVSMWIPDRRGKLGDILLGFDTIDGYLHASEKFHGAIIGRVCGRISNAGFLLDGTKYTLSANDIYGKPTPNHLHGGINGFHNCIWKQNLFTNQLGDEAIEFTYYSPHGEEGYPGNVTLSVIYTLRQTNMLCMECRASVDRNTPINLTNHAFFNLQSDQKKKNVLSQWLTICSSELIECNVELVPTGRRCSTINSPFDFRKSKRIIDAKKDCLFLGFSLAYILDETDSKLHLAAVLRDDVSGRRMEIYTNQPSIQVYTGYFMDGTDIGKNSIPYFAGAGIALETQGFTDAPNHPDFPSIIVTPDKPYYHITEYSFQIDE